jgi:adenylosuccinate lyase
MIDFEDVGAIMSPDSGLFQKRTLSMKTTLPDVLAERYASPPMVAVWSPTSKVVFERKLWVAALRAQGDLGLTVPDGAVEQYERVVDVVDLDSIADREMKTKHDVKARIEEFNALAGGLQLVHQGFTARDLTDNIEQLQILTSLTLVRDRTVSLLNWIAQAATHYQALDTCGRSHLIPGQATTIGKRFANFAEELLVAFERLEYLIANYPLRGIKGPMGTQQDMVDLLGEENAAAFERRMALHLGFSTVFDSVGQVYPRSLDFDAVSALVQLASAPANIAKMIRLMAGLELAHEGFKGEQSGSTAMPHKMNSRTCERVNGLKGVLGGFLHMAESLVGDQWFEGDVSCSVVRRVVFPGAFFAIDGLYEAAMTVLNEMEVFPVMVEQELYRFLPFLSTTRLLMAAIKKEMGREAAHAVIKKHATAAVKAMRTGSPNTFVERLAGDSDFPLNPMEISELVTAPDHGLAVDQTTRVLEKIREVVDRYPEAATYRPEPIR